MGPLANCQKGAVTVSRQFNSNSTFAHTIIQASHLCRQFNCTNTMPFTIMNDDNKAAVQDILDQLNDGDIPALRQVLQFVNDDIQAQANQAVLNFISPLIESFTQQRETLKSMASLLGGDAVTGSKKRGSPSVVALPRPAKKKRAFGNDRTNVEESCPVKAQKQRAGSISNNKGTAKKAAKKPRKSMSAKAAARAEKEAKRKEEEEQKERETIRRRGTARQKALLMAKEEKETTQQDARKHLQNDSDFLFLARRSSVFWSCLKKDNWTLVKPKSGYLNREWYYVRPGCSVKEGVLGEDYFVSLPDVAKYLVVNDLQEKYVKGVHERMDKSKVETAANETSEEVEPSKEAAMATVSSAPQQPVVATSDGKTNVQGMALVAPCTGVDPEGVKLACADDKKHIQATPIRDSSRPEGAIVGNANGSISTPKTPLTAAKRNDSTIDDPSALMTPETIGRHAQLKELQTTAKKAKQKMNSAKKAAQSAMKTVDAKKTSHHALRQKLQEQVQRAVTFQSTSVNLNTRIIGVESHSVTQGSSQSTRRGTPSCE